MLSIHFLLASEHPRVGDGGGVRRGRGVCWSLPLCASGRRGDAVRAMKTHLERRRETHPSLTPSTRREVQDARKNLRSLLSRVGEKKNEKKENEGKNTPFEKTGPDASERRATSTPAERVTAV